MNRIVNINYRDLNTTQALTVVMGWTVLFTYQISSQEIFKMTHFSNYMGTADWGNVNWRIKKNGIPISPYDLIVDQLGIQTLPRMTQPIEGRGGDLIEIEATLLAGAVDPNNIGIAIKYEVI